MTPVFHLFERYLGPRRALIALFAFYVLLIVSCTLVISYLPGSPMIYLDMHVR